MTATVPVAAQSAGSMDIPDSTIRSDYCGWCCFFDSLWKDLALTIFRLAKGQEDYGLAAALYFAVEFACDSKVY